MQVRVPIKGLGVFARREKPEQEPQCQRCRYAAKNKLNGERRKVLALRNRADIFVRTCSLVLLDWLV
jgi:hypothetical protein